MYQILKDSLLDFKQSYPRYLSFGLIYSFICSVLFVPLLSYVFNWTLKFIGHRSALLNQEVFTFGLSFRGVAVLFIISFLATAVLFIEFGVVIIMAHQGYFRHEVTISEALVTTLKKTPKLLGLGIFQLFYLLLFFIPFLDISNLQPLFDINMSIIIDEVLHESIVFKIVYFIVFACMVYLFIRWMFALHFVFIQDQSIWEAMKSSWVITKRGTFRVLFYLVVLNVLLILAGLLVVSVVSETAQLIDSKAVGDFLGDYLLTFSGYLSVVLSLFVIPINIMVLTRLFYQFQQQDKDKLVLKNNHPWIRKTEESITRFVSRRKMPLIILILVVLTGMFVINERINASVVYLKWDVDIAAHRGDSANAPENSMSSIRSAIDKGADAVEIDVAMTKDGVVVLSHDPGLKRTAGLPVKIKDLTYQQLKKVDIGRKFDHAYSGERIPKLDEVMNLASKTKTKVIVDVKANDRVENYADKIVQAVEHHHASKLALVQSFNNDFLQMVRKQNDQIRIGQILFLSTGNLSRLDVDFYTIRESMLTKRFMNRARKQNRDVWVWTVNRKKNMNKVLKYHIDGIITDYSERAHRVLDLK